MYEQTPQQPDQISIEYVLNYIKSLNKKQKWLRIQATKLENYYELFINILDKKFITLDKNRELLFKLYKTNTKQAEEWVKSWEKKIKTYEKAKDMIEYNVCDGSESITRYVRIKNNELKSNKIQDIRFIVIDDKEPNITIVFTTTDPYSGFINIFKNEKQAKDWIENVIQIIQKTNNLNNIVESLKFFETKAFDIYVYIKQIENRINQKYESQKNKIEIGKDNVIHVYRLVKNKDWEATDEIKYKNLKQFQEWVKTLKL